MTTRTARVGPDMTGRLDAVVRRLLPTISRRLVRTLIDEGIVRVNGRPARKGTPVQAGDLVEVPPLQGVEPDPDVVLRVLYEDAEVIAVDKPGGVPGHALDPRQRGTIAGGLVARDPELAGVGDPLSAGLVHRLDTGTSGVLVAARTTASHRALRESFRRHEVLKRYVAIVTGTPSVDAVVETPLAHDPGDRRRMRAARPGDRAWDARTHVCSVTAFGDRTRVEVEIRTGVTHQVRVHLALLGHPILGDTLYGGAPASLPPGRTALHASTLELAARGLRIAAPIPADLRGLFDPVDADSD